LASLPDELQENALYYFLDTFISNLNFISDTQYFPGFLLIKHPNWKPTYRKHYSIEEIGKNLGYLRTLCHNGSTKAAMVLASIVYTGLGEHPHYDPLTGYGLRDRDHRIFSVVTDPEKEKEPFFRDLEEFREITQSPTHVPDKVVRDILLLRYFEKKNDKEMVNHQLKQIDLSQAMWLDSRFCDDITILSCIKLEESGLQQLINNKQVLHHLINLGRLQVANDIKSSLPEEVLKEKDEAGRNILHTLVEYLSTDGIFRPGIVLMIFDFICQRFPDMLAEPDNQGHTVYDDIERLKEKLKSPYDEQILEKIESTIAECQEKLKSRLADHNRR
jgi:hypothetical protein